MSFWPCRWRRFFPREIEVYLEPLRPRFPQVKWVKSDQVHITLHFFGNETEESLKKIDRAVSPVAARYAALRLRLEGSGVFPNPLSPRVFWIGVGGDIGGLTRLQKEMEREIRGAGYSIEDRPFKAHATVGRARRDRRPQLSKAVELPSFPSTEERVCTRLVLFESHLSPEGPRYEVLQSFGFSQK